MRYTQEAVLIFDKNSLQHQRKNHGGWFGGGVQRRQESLACCEFENTGSVIAVGGMFGHKNVVRAIETAGPKDPVIRRIGPGWRDLFETTNLVLELPKWSWGSY